MPNCVGDQCVFTRGSSLTGGVFFTPTYLQNRLDAFVVANGNNLLPLNPPHDDACNSIFVNGGRVSCPTEPSIQLEWRFNVPLGSDLDSFNDGRIESNLIKINF